MSDSALTEDQILTVMRTVGEWMSIKERNKIANNSPDATHSSLLHWMLSGKNPLPHPPPCLMSRPQHGLATGDVITLLDPPIKLPEGDVLVGQNRTWAWEDVDKGLLRHLHSDILYHWDKENNTIQLASNLGINDDGVSDD